MESLSGLLEEFVPFRKVISVWRSRVGCWDEDASDGCYVADIPDLFACSAFGDSPEQALAKLEQARELAGSCP